MKQYNFTIRVKTQINNRDKTNTKIRLKTK